MSVIFKIFIFQKKRQKWR